jgi:hypothetical protein
MTILIVNGVNPLQTTLLELGIVSGRVALLLRSAEIQPVFGRFSMNGFAILPLPGSIMLLGGLENQGAARSQVPHSGGLQRCTPCS